MSPDFIQVHIPVIAVGAWAQRALLPGSPLSVMGVTSRGIFLRAGEKWVVFFTPERSHGPLTANLPRLPSVMQALEPGMPADHLDGRVVFPTLNAAFDLSEAQVWTAPSAASSSGSPQDRRDRLQALAAAVHARKRGQGTSDLLPHLLGLPEAPALDPPVARIFDTLAAIRPDTPAEVISAALTAHLGWGPGLTPSGDDLSAGLLLAFARCPSLRPDSLDWDVLARELTAAAYARTTTLAANLIECAAHGQADERLLRSLDAILAGNIDLEDVAESLARWGHSSGADSLVGISLAMELGAYR
jgi:hypothetical protein